MKWAYKKRLLDAWLKGLEIIDPLEIYGEVLGQIYLRALPDEGWDDEENWLETVEPVCEEL